MVIGVLLILFLMLQWSLWGERGIVSWYALERSNQRMQESNDQLHQRNESLARRDR